MDLLVVYSGLPFQNSNLWWWFWACFLGSKSIQLLHSGTDVPFNNDACQAARCCFRIKSFPNQQFAQNMQCTGKIYKMAVRGVNLVSYLACVLAHDGGPRADKGTAVPGLGSHCFKLFLMTSILVRSASAQSCAFIGVCQI